MITAWMPLLNGQSHPIPTTVPASGVGFYTPRQRDARSAAEIIYVVLVEQVVGAPAAAALQIEVQGGVPISKGNQTPPTNVGGGAGGNRYYFDEVAQQWFTLNADEHGSFLPDGPFPMVCADQAVSSGTLAAAVTAGDQTVTCTQQYAPGSTLNVATASAGDSALHVVGPATISGANWVHPIMPAPAALTSGATVHAPRAYFKRVLGGMDQRLLIRPTFTGGTSPAFIISAGYRTRG